MVQRKKKVLLHSNYCNAKTGFGRAAKDILKYLHKTGKYEVANYANGVLEGNQDFQKFPWRIYGSLPANQQQLNEINGNPGLAHKCGYGFFNLDKVITEFKPDVYINMEDFWALTLAECLDKKWWNKISCVTSITIDSRPILKDALEKASKINHFYVWAKFAEKEFKAEANRLEEKLKKEFRADVRKDLETKIAAYRNVKTLRGPVTSDEIAPLELHEKRELRKRYGIDQDTFLIGSSSRNQLRKLFPVVIQGFKIFKRDNPKVKTKLIFWTDLREGWDLVRLIGQEDLDPEDVLFCYKCRATNSLVISKFIGQEVDNPANGAKKSLVTVGIVDSLPTKDVNSFFNLLDVFTLPTTSSGMELNIWEAKLCEVPTIINSYAATEDLFDEETGSLEIDQAFTREIGTDFLKAAPYPASLAKQLKKVYEMHPTKRKELGKLARQWAIANASIEVIGKQWEDLLDSLPFTNYDFNLSDPKKDPSAIIPPETDVDKWIKSLYSIILKSEPDDQGFKYWQQRVAQGMSKGEIEQQFRQIAAQENAKNNHSKFEEFITKKPALLVVLKESIGDLINATAIIDSIKKAYPNHYIYLGTDAINHELFKYNENIYKCLPWIPEMDNEIAMTGQGKQIPLFDKYIHLGISTQKVLNYLSNDNITLLKK